MPESSHSIKNLFEKSQDYLENRIELTKLKAVDKSSEIVSSVTAIVVVMVLMVLFLMFASLGAAMAIGHALGTMYYGFLIIGAAYGIVGLIIFLCRDRWIKVPVANKLISNILK